MIYIVGWGGGILFSHPSVCNILGLQYLEKAMTEFHKIWANSFRFIIIMMDFHKIWANCF